MKRFLIVMMIIIFAPAIAAGAGNEPVVQGTQIFDMIEKDPSWLNSTDNFGRTPLYVAIEIGDETIANSLIDKGADLYFLSEQAPGQTALHIAARYNRLKVAEKLLAKGLDVHERSRNEFGVTPLHDAALGGGLEMIEFLLKKGANINALSRDGWTPLDDAYSAKRTEVIKLLEGRGAQRGMPLQRL